MRHSEPKIITPPKAYPLTLDEASEWLHVDPSNDLSENVGVETLIATATDMVENIVAGH